MKQRQELEEDTIDLIKLYSLLWKRKLTIIAMVLICGILASVTAFLITPKYTVSALIQPIDHSTGGGGASALASRFGGLASLAGVNLGGGSDDKTIAIATLKSRHLITDFINEEDLLPILFHKDWDANKNAWKLEIPPTLWDGHEIFKKDIMRLVEETESNLIVLSITWTDPQVAMKWVEALIARTNKYLQKKAKLESKKNLSFLQEQIQNAHVAEIRTTLSQMIMNEMKLAMMANVSDDYAFRIVDPASPPDLDDFSSPNRVLIIILGLVIGGIFGVFWVYVQSEVRKFTSD